MQRKICSKCNIEKDIDCFGNNTSGPAQYDSNGNRYKRPECKECNSKATKGRSLARKLSKNLETPPIGTPCELCGRAGTKRFPQLRFDHCHKTMKHRGWLCDPCNRSLGVLGDSIESFVKVINYLNKTENVLLEVEQNGILKIKE